MAKQDGGAGRWARWLAVVATFGGTAWLGSALAQQPAVEPAEAASAAAASEASPPSAELQARVAALTRASAAVVGVSVTAVDDARSIETLGRERFGSGVVIGDDGTVLTIGYLILEADRIDLLVQHRHVLPARVIAYDLATGFGLVKALTPISVAPAVLGASSGVAEDEPLMIATANPRLGPSLARVVSRRPFSGYWEYHIDGALFTAPARPDHSGAGLFNANGELVGIGSLIVADSRGRGQPQLQGNMFVPIDLMKPIFAELQARGASRDSTRAWLGVNCVELDGRVRVTRLTTDSPAEQAGLRPGDQIVRIDGAEVKSLEALYKNLWERGAPEREVKLDVERGGAVQSVTVRTIDRMKTLSKPQGI